MADRPAPKAEAPILSKSGGVGVLTFPLLTISTHNAGKNMPGRTRWKGRELRFELNEQTLAYVKRTWPETIWPGSLVPAAGSEAAAELPRGELDWEPVFPPFPCQADALRHGAERHVFAYLMDMGTGKSKVLIDNVAQLFSRGLVDRVVVVAPNGVHEQWVKDQLELHWPKNLPLRADAIISGKKKPEWWGKWDADPDKCKWVTFNIEIMKANKVRVGRRAQWELDPLGVDISNFLRAGKGLLAIDESHLIKNPQAKRSKALTMIGKEADYRRILTGSPMGIGLEDYYSQFLFLDPKIIGVYSMAGFKRQFCELGGFQNRSVIGYRNTEELHSRIAPFSFRVEKKDALDLPPKLYSEVTLSLTPQQRAPYDELRREFMTLLSDGSIMTAQEAIVRMTRLQQVVQGFLPLTNDDGEVVGYDEFPTNRMDQLKTIVEGASSKVVVWARFKRDIDLICEAYGDAAVRYDGQVGDEDRRANVAAFADPSSPVRLFVGNAAAGGTGVDGLQRVCDTVVYYSNSFNALQRWQSEDRTHRIGTTGTVNYYDLVARGTIDRMIINNLKSKKDISSMSLAELRQWVENEL